MTGIMLAVARAAGETAPLDLHGALQPVLDPITARADGLVVRPHLQFFNTPL